MKERIQHKAEELFRHYGIKSVTMDEIAHQLGMSKKTIYQFYADKDELVKDIFSIILECKKEKCTHIQTAAHNAIIEQYMSSESAQEIFSGMHSSVLFDLNRYYPDVFAEFEGFKKKFLFNIIKQNIVRGIEEGLFRKNIDINIITWLQLEMISGFFNNEDILSGKITAVRFEQEMKDFFLHGLCTGKGLNFIKTYKLQQQKKPA